MNTATLSGRFAAVLYRGAHTRRGRLRRQVALGLTAALVLTGLVVVPMVARPAAALVEPPPGGLVGSAPNFGWTKGEFSVSDDGAAQYSLPLWAPQGRGQSTPKLALSYSSRAGNGPLGVGWSLSGLPSITPCPRTYAQDGHTESLRFDQTDAWCLGSNRLVALSTAPGPEREFRTEREMFARIIAYGMGDMGDGVPDHFKIWAKDGLILTLGQTADSRLQAFKLGPVPSTVPNSSPNLGRVSDTQVAAAWAVNRIEDRNGNAATVEYAREESGDAGKWWVHMRPTVIRYAPNRRVEFGYENVTRPDPSVTRPDPIDGFAGGVHTRNPYRLTSITMFGGPEGETAQKLREYRLAYQNTSITGRSLLAEIKECDQDLTCKLPLPLVYSQGSYDFETIDLPTITDVGTSQDSGNRIVVGDVDGDGSDDLFYPDTQNGWWVRRSTGSGFTERLPSGILPSIPWRLDEQKQVRPVDFNLDGRMDVLAAVPDPGPGGCDDEPGGPPPCPADTDKTDWRLYVNTGSPNGPFWLGFHDMIPDQDPEATDQTPDAAYFADLDGNGLSDFLTATHERPSGDTSPSIDEPWAYRLNTGATGTDPFAAKVQTTVRRPSLAFPFPGLNTDGNHVVDSDGDGREELIGYGRNESDQARLYSFGLDAARAAEPSETILGWSQYRGDVNGDGLLDAVHTDNAAVPASLRASLSVGNRAGWETGELGSSGYTPPRGDPASDLAFDRGVRIVDFNNDGRDDVLIFRGGTPTGPDDHTRGVNLYVWQGDRFVRAPLSRYAGHWDEENGFGASQVLDIDGNGLGDIVHVHQGHLRVLKRQGERPDLLVGVGLFGAGPAAKISYTTLADRDVHTPCSGAVYPLVCPVRGETIVAKHQTATYALAGQEQWDTYTHTYKAARADVQGRGWLGFAAHSVTRELTGAITTTELDNTTRDATLKVYPYANLPKTVGVFTPTGPAGAASRHTTTYDNQIRRLGGSYTVEQQKVTRAEEERPPGVNVWQTLRTRITTTTYDTFGNPDRMVSATTGGRTLTEDPTFRNDTTNWLIGLPTEQVTTGCDAGGVCTTRTLTFDYDDKGNRVLSVTEPGRPQLKLTTRIEFGEFGIVKSVTSADDAGQARTETFEYGDADKLHPTATVNALGHRTAIKTHSGLGVQLEVSGPNPGEKATMRYDKFGRLRETTRADGSFERITHGSFIWQIATTEVSGGGRTAVVVDQLDRERERRVKAFDGREATTYTDYDPRGRLGRVSRPEFAGETRRYTTYSYDGLDRVKSTTAPDGAVIRHDYRGLETHTFDAEDVESYTVANKDGEVASSFEDDPNSTAWLETRFDYDGFGQTTKITAPDGTAQTMRYDLLGRRVELVDPSSGKTTTGYNAFREVTSETDGAGRITTTVYDALGRVTQVGSSDGTATNTWDTATNGKGKLASAASADGITTAYTYNDLSQVQTASWTVDGVAYQFDYAYSLGRPDTLTYPAIPGAAGAERLKIANVYNPHGYLSQVRDAAGGPVYWQIPPDGRNAAGQLTKETFGNGVTTTRTYQPTTGLPVDITTTGPGAVGKLVDLSVGYDPNRNVSSRMDWVAGRSEVYGYDTLDRLTTWRLEHGGTVTSTSTTYTYDKVGNLQTETSTGSPDPPDVTHTYGYEDPDGGAPPHALTARNSDRYTYDRAGRQLTGPRRSVVAYNRAGLPKILDWGQDLQKRTEFAYDPSGARARKRDRDGGQTVIYAGGLFERRSPAGTGSTQIHNLHNIAADGRVVAQVNRVQAATGGPITSTGVNYLHPDQQGSTVVVSNPAGGRVGGEEDFLHELFYNPWGQRTDANGAPLGPQRPGGPRQGYTGHYHDDEYGLIDAKGRWYDPTARRFLTPDPVLADPLASQALNRYAYVRNNPATLTDPTGLVVTNEQDGGGTGDSSLMAWWRGDTSVLGKGSQPSSPTPFDAPLITHAPDMTTLPNGCVTALVADDDESNAGSTDGEAADPDPKEAADAVDTAVDGMNALDIGGRVVKVIGAVLDIIVEGPNAVNGLVESCHGVGDCIWAGVNTALSGLEAAGGIMTWFHVVYEGRFTAGAAAAAEAFPVLILLAEIAAVAGVAIWSFTAFNKMRENGTLVQYWAAQTQANVAMADAVIDGIASLGRSIVNEVDEVVFGVSDSVTQTYNSTDYWRNYYESSIQPTIEYQNAVQQIYGQGGGIVIPFPWGQR